MTEQDKPASEQGEREKCPACDKDIIGERDICPRCGYHIGHARLKNVIATLRQQLADEQASSKEFENIIREMCKDMAVLREQLATAEQQIETARADGWDAGRDAAASLVVETKQVRSSGDRASIVWQIRELKDPLATQPPPKTETRNICGGSGHYYTGGAKTWHKCPGCPDCQKGGER